MADTLELYSQNSVKALTLCPDHNVLLSELNNLDVDPHLVRWIAACLLNNLESAG